MSVVNSIGSQALHLEDKLLLQARLNQVQQFLGNTLATHLQEQSREDATRLALNKRLADAQALVNAQLRARVEAQQVVDKTLDFDLQPGTSCAEANPLSDRQIVVHQRGAEMSWFAAATQAGSADTTAEGSAPGVALFETPRR